MFWIADSSASSKPPSPVITICSKRCGSSLRLKCSTACCAPPKSMRVMILAILIFLGEFGGTAFLET